MGSFIIGILSAIAAGCTVQSAEVSFTKITAGTLVTERSTFGSCALGDFDDDGWLDIAVGSGGDTGAVGPLRLFRNDATGNLTFTKLTSGPIPASVINAGGLAWADYDNDGFLDLLVANFEGPNLVFHNNRNGTFTKYTNAPIASDGNLGDNVAWADYDNDGHLDAFVSRFSQNRSQPNLFYRNNQDGTFNRLTNTSLGRIVSDSGTMATVAWADYDNDGDLDLFLTRPYSTDGSLFYRNNGDGTFTSLSRTVLGGVVDDTAANGSMGAAWADYDNDGDLDLFVTRGAGIRAPANLLWRNNGDGTFTRMTTNEVGAVVGESLSSISCAWADYDNDGWLDLFVSNTAFGNPAGADNSLYHNNLNGFFSKVTNYVVVHDGGNSWGCAWGDFNNDGFPDLFVANGYAATAATNFLYRNDGNSNHWLKLKLIGTLSNRSAIGAKVRVRATIGGRTFWQLREISGSAQRFGQQDMRPNFGLGDATNIDLVRIEWPSGGLQELRAVRTDQILTVTEPPRLRAIGQGQLEFRSWPQQVFSIDASVNLTEWLHLALETNLSGSFHFDDPDASGLAWRFYRVLPVGR